MISSNFFLNKMECHLFNLKINTVWRLEYFMLMLRQKTQHIIAKKL